MARAQRRFLVPLVAASLLLAACGNDGDVGDNGDEAASGDEAAASGEEAADTGDGPGPASVTEGLGVGETYSVLGALAELPPSPVDAFVVQTGDLTAAGELAGLERPDTLDPDAVRAWLGPLTGGPTDTPEEVPVIVHPPSVLVQTAQYQEFHDLAGWSVLDMDSYVEFGTEPYRFTVVAGNFADGTLDHLPEVGDGVRTVGEGEDLHLDLDQISAVSRIGQPVRMAQADGTLAMAPHTPRVRSWLTGTGETLADHPGAAGLARALDAEGVVSAMLQLGQYGQFADLPLPDHLQGSDGPWEDVLPEQPFEAVGLGFAVQEDEPTIVVAYLYPSGAMAEEAAEPLATMITEAESFRSGLPLRELVELDRIVVDGPVATAVLRAVDPNAPRQFPGLLMSRDVPFLHQ